MLRKTKPLERFLNRGVTQLPSISPSFGSKSVGKPKKLKVAKTDSSNPVDIETLIETKVKKLKHNAFLYLMYTVPNTSEHFTPYNLT